MTSSQRQVGGGFSIQHLGGWWLYFHDLGGWMATMKRAGRGMASDDDWVPDQLTPQQRWARSEANCCFVCGPSNPIGLHLEFDLDGEVCRAEFTPGEHHVGYGGVLHGGILYSALDDVMANVLYLRGLQAVTARCEIRYRGEPVRVGTTILLEGRLRRRKGPLAIIDGRALRESDREVVAECEGSFMVTGVVPGLE